MPSRSLLSLDWGRGSTETEVPSSGGREELDGPAIVQSGRVAEQNRHYAQPVSVDGCGGSGVSYIHLFSLLLGRRLRSGFSAASVC